MVHDILSNDNGHFLSYMVGYVALFFPRHCSPSTHWLMLFGLFFLLISMVSGTGPTPGLKLHGLDIWENSALPGIFSSVYAQEYLFFRSYALTILSDCVNIKNTVVHSNTGIGRPTRRLHSGKHVDVELSMCTNHVSSYM